jgi:hypothetical protein
MSHLWKYLLGIAGSGRYQFWERIEIGKLKLAVDYYCPISKAIASLVTHMPGCALLWLESGPKPLVSVLAKWNHQRLGHARLWGASDGSCAHSWMCLLTSMWETMREKRIENFWFPITLFSLTPCSWSWLLPGYTKEIFQKLTSFALIHKGIGRRWWWW